MHVMEWVGYSNMYMDAAKQLPATEHNLKLPATQLCGHAIECALKACLLAKGIEPALTHNLVKLADDAIASGYVLQEFELVQVVHLNQNYYASLISDAKFRARYPAQYFQGRREPVASPMLVSTIVASLCAQAAANNEGSNREKFLSGTVS